MNEETIELARRAVASPHWRWMPGMLLFCPESGACYRATNGVPAWDHGIYQTGGMSEDWQAAPDNVVPGLTDPATRGCLLALVREALSEPLACVEVRQPGDTGYRAILRVPVGSEGWRVVGWQWWGTSRCPAMLEAAALVAALEAAPAPEVER
jgi:hypothetical protein